MADFSTLYGVQLFLKGGQIQSIPYSLRKMEMKNKQFKLWAPTPQVVRTETAKACLSAVNCQA